MNFLEKTFKRTHYFWIVSRVLLIILFSNAISFLFREKTGIGSLIVTTILVIFVLSMAITFIQEIIKKKRMKILLLYNSIFVIFFSIISILASIQILGIKETLIVLFLPSWWLLFGVWEWLNKLQLDSKKS